MGLSPDLSKAYGTSSKRLTPDAALLNGSWGLYVRSSGQAELYTLLSRPWQPLGPDASRDRFQFAGATPDGRHVVFNSSRRILPGGPGDSSRMNAVYEWVDGTVRLASVPLPGATFSGLDAWAGVSRLDVATRNGYHVISDDGRRLFFTADGALYVREDGTTTRAVSAIQGPGQPTPTTGRFWTARSTDGSVAIFSASGALTPDANGASLYRWGADAQQGALTAITHDLDGGDSGVQQAPAAVSADASSVAFVATGKLTRDTPEDGQNLFLWRHGEGVRFIATIDPVLDLMLSRISLDNGGPAARLSEDGERVLFASYAQIPLDRPYDTTEATPEACGSVTTAGDRCRQIYLYDARSDDLSCLTCVPGVPVSGDANLFGNGDTRRPREGGVPDTTSPVELPRNLSADGTRAFFETARPLVAEDRNTKVDVYEWSDRDLDGRGELRLISPGRGTSDSEFLDASASGNDVFFTTREQLVGIDRDNQVDLYDARVGGGIPAQNPPPASPCEGEGCQGAFSGAPSLAGVGSGGASHGNLRPGRRPSFSVARLSRAQLAQLARGRRVAVRVRVSRAGRVSLTARAKLGRRVRAVARASKAARRAGTVHVGLKLARSARRELAGKGTLNVRLSVRFTGVREARTSTLRLRRARSSDERGAR
jgi:hypothetical protein